MTHAPETGGKAVTRQDLLRALLLVLLWACLVALADPRGDFPLNDDWTYSRAVRTLLTEGDYRPLPWGSSTLVVQVLWGALFCLPFGFSFMALRLSTLVLGALCVGVVYLICRRLGHAPGLAAAAALVLGCNPLFFALAGTFMTDVPFLALAATSASLFAAVLAPGSDPRARGRLLLAATLVACAATLVRQLGLYIPLGYAAAVLWRDGLRPRALLRAVWPAMLTAGVLAVFLVWLRSTASGSMVEAQAAGALQSATSGLVSSLFLFAKRLFVTISYVGLCLAPLLLLVGPRWWAGLAAVERRVALASAALFAPAATALCVVWKKLMPMTVNVVEATGIGPVLLRDVYHLQLTRLPSAPTWLLVAITAVSVAGATAFVAMLGAWTVRLWRALRERRRAPHARELFWVAAMAAYVPPLAFSWFFDRYMLPLVLMGIPFVLDLTPRAAPVRVTGGVARGVAPALRWAGAALLALSTLGSVAMVHDYLSWNRARWAVIGRLEREFGAGAETLDGGYEYNGWHNYTTGSTPESEQLARPGKSPWVHDDLYVVTLGPVPGYEPVVRVALPRWLPVRQDVMYGMRRTGAPATAGAPAATVPTTAPTTAAGRGAGA